MWARFDRLDWSLGLDFKANAQHRRRLLRNLSFGWPVTLVAALKINAPSPLLVFFASVPFVFLFGFLMRRWVETPVNDWLKPAILRRVPRFAESRAPVSSLSSLQQWIQRLTYWGFFLGLVRFVFYPWPGSANWFGNQIYQLGILACLVALTLRIVQRRRRGTLPPRPDRHAESDGIHAALVSH